MSHAEQIAMLMLQQDLVKIAAERADAVFERDRYREALERVDRLMLNGKFREAWGVVLAAVGGDPE